MRVKAGDEIDLDVYFKEAGTSDEDPATMSIGDLLEQHANDAELGLEGTPLSNAVGANVANLLAAVITSSSQTRAYLQYILFDETFSVVAQDFSR